MSYHFFFFLTRLFHTMCSSTQRHIISGCLYFFSNTSSHNDDGLNPLDHKSCKLWDLSSITYWLKYFYKGNFCSFTIGFLIIQLAWKRQFFPFHCLFSKSWIWSWASSNSYQLIFLCLYESTIVHDRFDGLSPLKLLPFWSPNDLILACGNLTQLAFKSF